MKIRWLRVISILMMVTGVVLVAWSLQQLIPMVLWGVGMVFGFVFLDFQTSIMGKRYKGYWPRLKVQTAWQWVHGSWNYIGPSFNSQRHYIEGIAVRHIGVRWFGHEWELEIEIPMGELRF